MTERPALTHTIEKHESPYYSPNIVNGLIQMIPVENMYICISGWVVTWFLLGYTVRKNGGLLSTPMF